MSLFITRPSTETVGSTNSDSQLTITTKRKFEVMIHDDSLYFVRQGGVGSKVCDLTDAMLDQLRDLEGGVDLEEQQ